MKVLFIGGTGNISTAVSTLAVKRGVELYLLTRGTHPVTIAGAKSFTGDISDREQMASLLKEHSWDVVVNWVAFTEDDIQRDIELFRGKTKQYIFISSASAYQKPVSHPIITESTPLANPYWQYSRHKIACEDRLMRVYREEQFPITIVRPSHTYDTVIPVAIGGWKEYTIIDRLKKGKPIIIHGDGTALWVLTHSEDFAKGFVGLLGHQQAIGHAFHITSDEALTWNQIYDTLAEAVGVEAKKVYLPSEVICRFNDEYIGQLLGDKAHSVMFDNTKIKRFVPGFTAIIPYHEGIRRTLSWLEADPARQRINPGTDRFMDTLAQAYNRRA